MALHLRETKGENPFTGHNTDVGVLKKNPV